MAENIISNKVIGHDDTGGTVKNWISQINAGDITYDIATHHGITFKDGKGDTTGVTWTGLQDLEIVIPNITDIVQSPIEFAGTVAADGIITWNEDHTDGPKTGYLVFVAEDCEFEGQACEAGDMAIYDGSKWNIVSGENQVKIVSNGKAEGVTETNRTVVAIGSAKDVLVVEGKSLSLTIDYDDLNNHVETDGGKNETASGSATVGVKYLKLKKEEDSEATIGTETTISVATALSNGSVTFTGTSDLVTDVTFGTFTQGSMPTAILNADDRTFNVSGGSLTKISNSEDFITSVSLNGAVTLTSGIEGENGSFPLINGITATPGKKAFVTGISGKQEFTIEGYIKPKEGKDATYLKGLAGGLTEVVTSIDSGSFTYNSSVKTFVTGFSDNSNSVISSVSLSVNNETSVLSSATVKDHVLSFGSTNVASNVSVSTTDKNLVKGGYTYTAPSATKTSFTTGGFDVSESVTYKFETSNETNYNITTSLYKLITPELSVSKAGYSLDNDGMHVLVSKDTFAVGITAGTLPTFTSGSVTRNANLEGSVATALTFTNEKFTTLTSDAITVQGAYSLVDGNVDDNDVTVGAAGTIDVTATVDLSSYLTGVSIVKNVVNE